MKDDLMDAIEAHNQDVMEHAAKIQKIRRAHTPGYEDETSLNDHVVNLMDDEYEEDHLSEEAEQLLDYTERVVDGGYDDDTADDEDAIYVEDAIDPIVDLLEHVDRIPMFSDDKLKKETAMYVQNDGTVLDCMTNQPIMLPNNQPLRLPPDQMPTCPVTYALDDYNKIRINNSGLPVLAYQVAQNTWAEWLPGIEKCTGFFGGPQQQDHGYATYEQHGAIANQSARLDARQSSTGSYTSDRYASARQGSTTPTQPQYANYQEGPMTHSGESTSLPSVDSNLTISYDGEEIPVLPIKDLPNRSAKGYGELGDYDQFYAVVGGYVGDSLIEFLVEADELERTLEYGGTLHPAHATGVKVDVVKAPETTDQSITKDPVLTVARSVKISAVSSEDARWLANQYFYRGEERHPNDIVLTDISFDVTMDEGIPLPLMQEAQVDSPESFIEFYEKLLAHSDFRRTARLMNAFVTKHVNNVIKYCLGTINAGLSIDSLSADWKDLKAFFQERGEEEYRIFTTEMELLFGRGLRIEVNEDEDERDCGLMVTLEAPLVTYEDDLDIPLGRLLTKGLEDLYRLVKTAARTCGTNSVFVYTHDHHLYQMYLSSSMSSPAIFVTQRL